MINLLDVTDEIGVEDESTNIVPIENLDLLESEISEDQEELIGLEAKLSSAIEVYEKLSLEVENDKLIYESGTYELGTESVLKSYEDALFDLDIEQGDLEPIIGVESAQNDADTLLVGIEAKDSILTTISTKIRQFIKAIRRTLKKLGTSAIVYLGTIGRDVAALADTIEELESTEGIILKGPDADSDLKKRIRTILNFYLTEECASFSKLTKDLTVTSLSANPVVRAVELLEANIVSGYDESNFERIRDIYSEFIENSGKEKLGATTAQKRTVLMMKNYKKNLGKKAFPGNSTVRKILNKHEGEGILIRVTTRPEKVTLRLLVDHKKSGDKRKWMKVTGDQPFRSNSVDLIDIPNEKLRDIASIIKRVITNYDLKTLVDSSFDLLKDLDDGLAEIEASKKGNQKKLARLRAIVDFNNSATSDYIFATLANNKAMYRLLRTLAHHAEDIGKGDK